MRLEKGDVVRHFKREMLTDKQRESSNKYLYYIRDIALDADTGEKLIVYKALYPPYQTFVRTMKDFMSLVDTTKYPHIDQSFRFEKVSRIREIIIRRILYK